MGHTRVVTAIIAFLTITITFSSHPALVVAQQLRAKSGGGVGSDSSTTTTTTPKASATTSSPEAIEVVADGSNTNHLPSHAHKEANTELNGNGGGSTTSTSTTASEGAAHAANNDLSIEELVHQLKAKLDAATALPHTATTTTTTTTTTTPTPDNSNKASSSPFFAFSPWGQNSGVIIRPPPHPVEGVLSNWGGAYKFKPAVVVEAKSYDDIVTAVRDHIKYPSPVRALGE